MRKSELFAKSALFRHFGSRGTSKTPTFIAIFGKCAKSAKNQFGRPLLRKVRFRHPKSGKTCVHVVNLHNGDFCDDICKIFPFSEKCVCGTCFFIGVGGVRQQPLHGILNGGVSLPRGAERECRRGAERPCRRGQSAHAARGGGAGW